MRSAWLKCALLIGVSSTAAVAQINPHTQIRWPTNCNTAGMTYNFNLNSCIVVGPVGNTGDVQINNAGAWATAAGFNYNFGTNTLSIPNLNVAGTSTITIPPTQVSWPSNCNSNNFMTYNLASNSCLDIRPNIAAGTTTTLAPGSQATVTQTGSFPNYVLNFGIPAGVPGGSLSYPGVISDGNNGLNIQGGVGIGTQRRVVVCGGVNDTAAVQLALNATGYIEVTGNCLFPSGSGALTISSNTEFNAGAATLTCTIQPCLKNTQFSQNVQRTFTDAVLTAGSTTITSATANFTGADVANVSIHCTGGIASTPTLVGYPNVGSTTLSTTILSVTNATTAVLNDPPSASVNPSTCTVLVRDKNIRIRGGKWIMAGANVTSSSGQHLQFYTVNDLNLQDMWFQNGTTGLSTQQGSKNIAIVDASRFMVRNITFNSWVVLQDGLDMYGPLRDFTVRDIFGHTGDNSVAVTQSAGAATGPGQGVVDGGLIENVNSAAGFGAIRLFGFDGGSPILTQNMTIRHYRGSQNGTGGGVQIYYGDFDNLLVDDVSGNMTGAVQVSGARVGTLTIRNVSINPPNAATTYNSSASIVSLGAGNIAGVGPTINNLSIDGVKSNNYNGSYAVNNGLFNSLVNSTVNHFAISNVQLYNFGAPAGQTAIPFEFVGLSANDISFSNVKVFYNTLAAIGATVQFRGQSTINKISLNGVHVDHAPGSLTSTAVLGFLNFGGLNPTVGDVLFNDISLTAPSSLAGTYVLANNGNVVTAPQFSNIRINNVAGCMTGTINPTANLTNLYATNITTPASCAIFSHGQAIPAFNLTNQTANIAPVTVYTSQVANEMVQVNCALSTGSATGTGTAIAYLQYKAANFYNSPTLTFTAGATVSWSSVYTIPNAGFAVTVQVNYTAGTGGNYNANCSLSKF